MSKSNNEWNKHTKASVHDTPNPHFLDFSDEQLRAYIASNPEYTADFLLGAEAAQKELNRRALVRASFLT